MKKTRLWWPLRLALLFKSIPRLDVMIEPISDLKAPVRLSICTPSGGILGSVDLSIEQARAIGSKIVEYADYADSFRRK